MDWPKVCKHLGIDPTKYCGPVAMAAGSWPEGNCCFGHPKGSALHKKPIVHGKPFRLEDHRAELEKLGLSMVKPELIAKRKAGEMPDGEARRIGQALVFPRPHFA